MGITSFFKVAKHKQFSFAPRYYDERRERREELIRQLEEEDARRRGEEGGEHRSGITRGSMRAVHARKLKAESRTSTYRLLIILALLTAIFYWLLR